MMDRAWYEVENLQEIFSPGLLVYRDRVARNIAKMISMVRSPGWLRPHIKTHKMPAVIDLCLQQGVRKFKCATPAEAEILGQQGAPDVLLAYQLVGPAVGRLEKLVAQFPQTRFSTIIDDREAAHAISQTFANSPLEIYVDVDCGMHRTGIPLSEVPELLKELKLLPGLKVAGIHSYDGHIHASDVQERARLYREAFEPIHQFVRQEGFALVAGGTPTFPFHAQEGLAECSPGTPVFWDFGYGEKFPDLPFEVAAVLLGRVIGKPGANRLCLDLGYKAMASESPQPRVRFPQLPEASLVMQSEEHLVIECPEASRFNTGDPLYAIPRHICPTCALFSQAAVIENHRLVDRWSIAARERQITI